MPACMVAAFWICSGVRTLRVSRAVASRSRIRDPIATQLDLTVEPPGAVEQAAHRVDGAEVAGPIGATAVGEHEKRPPAAVARVGSGHQVAGGDLRTGDHDLAVRAVRQPSRRVIGVGDPDPPSNRCASAMSCTSPNAAAFLPHRAHRL